ncbi:MAG: hypothetical protein AAF612_12095 [Planctomycetota bacterium]
MSRRVTPDSTDESLAFFVYDAITGDPATITASATNLAATYQRYASGRPLAAAVAITPLSDLGSAEQVTHVDGGLIVADAATGEHRLDVPDAAFAAGAEAVRVRVTADGYRVVLGGVTLSSLEADAAAARVAAEAAGENAQLHTRVVNNGDGTKWLQVYPTSVAVEGVDPAPAGWTIRFKINAKGEQVGVEVAA